MAGGLPGGLQVGYYLLVSNQEGFWCISGGTVRSTGVLMVGTGSSDWWRKCGEREIDRGREIEIDRERDTERRETETETERSAGMCQVTLCGVDGVNIVTL